MTRTLLAPPSRTRTHGRSRVAPTGLPLDDSRVQVKVSVVRRLVTLHVDGSAVVMTSAQTEAFAGLLAEARALLVDVRAGTLADGALLMLGDIEFCHTIGFGWNVLCGLCKAEYGTGHTLGPDDCDLPTLALGSGAAVRHRASRHHVPSDRPTGRP